MYKNAKTGTKPEVVGKSLRLRDGVLMPLLSFGTWRVDNDKCGELVYSAIKEGCRHIDAAQIYCNHVETGKAIKKAVSEGIVKREELFVTSKIWSSEFDPKDVKLAVETILKELDLEYVDLILLHWPFKVVRDANTPFPIGERGNVAVDFSVPRYATYKALEECQKLKMTKSIGVSNYMQEHMAEILSQCEIPPVTNQIEFHLFLQSWNLHEFCMHYNVSITAYSALGYYDTTTPSPLTDERVAEIAKKYGKTNAHVCLRYLTQHGIVTIFKSNQADRIKDNLSSMDFDISEEDMIKLKDLQKMKQRCLNIFPDYLFETRNLGDDCKLCQL